jgi:hypothetical protein
MPVRRFWLAVLVAWVAPVCAEVAFEVPRYETPADNAFDHYVAAAALLPKDRPWDDLYDQLDSASLADAEAAVLVAQEALDELRQGIGKPCVVPPVEDYSTSLAYLADFRSLTRLLLVEALVHARRGDFASAFRSCQDALTLGQDAARGGAPIHKLVSIACEAMACREVRRTVGLCGDVGALTDLLAALQAFEDREVPLSEALALEYAVARRVLEGSKQRPDLLDPLWPEGMKPPLIPPEAPDQALGDLDPLYSRLVSLAQMDYPRLVEEPLNVETGNLLLDALAPNMERLIDRATGHRATLRGTLLVAALGLHLAKHESYPEGLSELVPSTLKQLPVDPFSGQAFRYRLIDPLTYTLYSVGPDMKDDGGVQERLIGDAGGAVPGLRGGDIVFSPD